MKDRINSQLQIIFEYTNLFKNRHYILFEIEGNIILSEIEMNWKEIPEL
ncbi:unnamed protein product [marine sediment metagenome]|uniref:Uncharacterized protein n=1 Tax=marine sediment metagenome TaxID=412755 RepID=X1KGP4_9ZZZZ